MKKQLICFIILFCMSWSAFPAYMTNIPVKIKQPNGIEINCFASGDEFYNWLHDANGYTIVQAEDGFYYYGITSNGSVVPSAIRVSSDPDIKMKSASLESLGLKPYARISRENYLKRRSEFHGSGNYKEDTQLKSAQISASENKGTIHNLVFYIRFKGDEEFSKTRSDYDKYFNSDINYSLKSYYKEVSYEKLTINSTHYPTCVISTNLSYEDSNSVKYYQPYNFFTNKQGYKEEEKYQRRQTLLKNAIEWIIATSPVPGDLNLDYNDDGNIDNICFIVNTESAEWSDLLWAHCSNLNLFSVNFNGKKVSDYILMPLNRFDPTVICHEMFHVLGAPDLYHYNENSKDLNPVGPWDLMGNGCGHMGAYMKWKYGHWIDEIFEIKESVAGGNYLLYPLRIAQDKLTTSPYPPYYYRRNCYKIASPNYPNKYFIVEYRDNVGKFESQLPGKGMLVYRINTAGIEGNAYGPPDEVYVYRPDGTLTENGKIDKACNYNWEDPYQINDQTNPSSFLQNGNPGGLNIYGIWDYGTSDFISFNIKVESRVNDIGRRYVTQNGAGKMDGSSWDNAYPDSQFQTAIDESISGQEVWVAKGIYYPTKYLSENSGPVTESERFKSIIIKDGVNLYGGFWGDESSLNERRKADSDGNGKIESWEFMNETVLSGDIDGLPDEWNWNETEKKWDVRNNSNNSYHVIYDNKIGFIHKTNINGFTLKGGNANHPSYTNYSTGGSFWAANNAIIDQCIITNNSCMFGGGIALNAGSILTNSCIHSNKGDIGNNVMCSGRGGGVYSNNNGTLISNCTIRNNSSDREGGGVYAWGGEFTECIISDNYSSHWGGGVMANNNTIITSCTIKNNQSKIGGGGLYLDNSESSDSKVIDNYSSYYGGGIRMVSGKLNRSIIADNFAASDGGGIDAYSSEINNCSVYNNTAEYGGGINGNDNKIINCTITRNNASKSGGGLFLGNGELRNVILALNSNEDNFFSLPKITYTGSDFKVYEGLGNQFLSSPSQNFQNPTTFAGISENEDQKSEIEQANWHLVSGSQCIDAGPVSDESETDVEGNPRKLGFAVNLGAYEMAVKDLNHVPTAIAGEDQTVIEGETVQLDGSFSYDSDSDSLTFLWIYPQDIGILSHSAVTPEFIAPEVKTDTSFVLYLKIYDPYSASNKDSVVIRVLNVNKFPIAVAGSDQNVNEGDTVLLSGYSSFDADGDRLSYLWEVPEQIKLNSFLTPKIEFIAPKVSKDTTFVCSLTVNDEKCNSKPDSVYITVKNRDFPQVIDLKKGWNIISFMVIPDSSDMKSLFRPLINESSLIKVQDESGNSLEDYGIFGGWINNIGKMALSEGYKVKLARDCHLSIEGVPAAFPFKIPLKAGWNIMGYPLSSKTEGKIILKQLIEEGILVKVQDETGNSIEDYGILGGWTNNIGNFKTGEGYKIKVSTDHLFTVHNRPWGLPFNPAPADSSSGVSQTPDLSWECYYLAEDTLTFDLYMGTSPDALELLIKDLSARHFTPPSGLIYGTTWFWKIITKDVRGNTCEGPVWEFKVRNETGSYIP